MKSNNNLAWSLKPHQGITLSSESFGQTKKDKCQAAGNDWCMDGDCNLKTLQSNQQIASILT